MTRYPLVPLGEVLRLSRDEVRVEPDQTYQTAGIYSFGRGLFARAPITGADTKYTSLFRLHEGQLVLSRLKGWEGAIAVVPAAFDGYCVSQEYPTFEVVGERAEAAYLRWLCRWDRFWSLLLVESKGVGARRDRVHPDRLFAVEVPMPSLSEQRRIVDYVDRIAARAQPAAVLQDSISQAHAGITGSVLRACSDSAPSVPLGEVLRLSRDEVRVEPDQTYQTAGIYSFGRGLFARAPITGADTKYTSLFRLHEGQLVYSRLFAWEGALSVVPSDFDGAYVSQEFPTFVVDRARAEPAYLGWLCRWRPFWELLRGEATGLGLRRQRVHPDRLLAVHVPLPPLPEQRRLAALAGLVVALASSSRQAAMGLDALIPSLLRAVFDGRG
jgi:type I restriction enzyme S subunit